MKFSITHFLVLIIIIITHVLVLLSVRYDPLSSYVYHMYIALCLTPKICIDYCFQILLGGLYIPKRI